MALCKGHFEKSKIECNGRTHETMAMELAVM